MGGGPAAHDGWRSRGIYRLAGGWGAESATAARITPTIAARSRGKGWLPSASANVASCSSWVELSVQPGLLRRTVPEYRRWLIPNPGLVLTVATSEPVSRPWVKAAVTGPNGEVRSTVCSCIGYSQCRLGRPP